MPSTSVLDLAFPVLEALKKYTIKTPTIGYYIKQVFKDLTWVTILLRIIDAFTDIALTKTYFQDWDESVVKDFLQNTNCSQQDQHEFNCSNVTYVRNECLQNSDWNQRLVCSFPLMTWWISGTLSVIVLAITYLAEVVSTLEYSKFDHYFEIFSRVCCKEHKEGTIFVYGFILPLSQQMTCLIYCHWIKSFVGYWQDKSKNMIKSLTLNKTNCIQHCNENEWENKICMICNHNVEDSEKLDKLMTKSNDVESHGQKLFASTENLLMPMVQFGFLFPVVLNIAFKTDNSSLENHTATDQNNSNFQNIIEKLPANWTIILIIFSIISSLLSLIRSQTRIYFAAPGKKNQKSVTNTVLIFMIIMLQVLPKILSFQAFSFGLVGSELQCPDAILVLLLAFPYFSSTWKTLMVALCLSIFHKLTFHKIKNLFLSPFIFTRIEKGDTKDKNQCQIDEKQSGFVMTENGKCHLLFDTMSLMENCVLSITGSYYIGKYEKTFDSYKFCGVIVVFQVLGLLMKLMYYQYQHSWMKLSPARQCMGKVSFAIILILVISIAIGIPIIASMLPPGSPSTMLYILTGFYSFVVSCKVLVYMFALKKHFTILVIVIKSSS